MTGEAPKAERFLMHLEPLQGALEAFCRRNLLDRNAVEDALQSTVALAFRDFDLYAEGTNFRAWIFRYLNIEILARNRRHIESRRRPLPQEPAAEDSGPQGFAGDELEQLLDAPEVVLEHCDEALVAAMHDLSSVERSVFLLRAIGEFKYREIAEILEIPIGSVMGYLSRSRERLRRRLAEFGEDRGLLEIEGSED